MRFKGLDLNLLVAFDSLLDTRNVSRSAERLNLSQSALSAALARLRDYFNDPILVPHGRRMHPTAFAESLLPQVRDALRQIDAVVATSTSFDPPTSRRKFGIINSDYVTIAVMVPLIRRLAEIAPTVAIEMMLPGEHSAQRLEEGSIDIVIVPDGYASPNHPSDLLFEERHVVVGWSGNPVLHGPVSAEDFCSAGHVAVSVGAFHTPSFADRHLEMLGVERRIEVRAPAFATVPALLEGTSRLAVMHERLALMLARRLPIGIQPLPFTIPLLRQMMQYHRARTMDEGLVWLRQQIADVSAAPIG